MERTKKKDLLMGSMGEVPARYTADLSRRARPAGQGLAFAVVTFAPGPNSIHR